MKIVELEGLMERPPSLVEKYMGRLFLVCFAIVALVVSARAQSTVDITDWPTFASGSSITCMDFNGAGGAQKMPQSATYTNSVSSPGTNFSVNWEIGKTKGYNRVSGTFYTLGTPMGVNSQSHGWATGSRTIDFITPFWAWFGARTVDDDRYGEFYIKCQYRPSGTTYTTVTYFTWKLRPQDYVNGGDGSNGNGSNTGGGSHDSSTDPVNSNGFWSDMFVPGADCINDLKDAANLIGNWGPFGWYSVVSGKIQDNSATRVDADVEHPYSIMIPIPENSTVAPGVGGTYDLDLSPYQDLLKFIRAILAGMMWYTFIFVIGKKVYAKL